MAEDRLQSLLDREAIRDVLMRYSRGIDRCDRALLESVYWPEAVDDHGSFTGKALDFIDWALGVLQTMDQTSHMLGNILIRLNGDCAYVETYFEAYHRIRRESGSPYDAVLGGRYVDRMERRGDEWRIGDRLAIYDWVREFADSADWSSNVLGLGLPIQSNRIETDPSYRMLDLNEARTSPALPQGGGIKPPAG
jgi:hypothetical protein